jgi:hypothetical protein
MIGEYREWADQVTHSLAQLELRVERLEQRAAAGRLAVAGAAVVAVGVFAAVGVAGFRALTRGQPWRGDRR